MVEKVVVRDNQARMRLTGYLSPLLLLLFGSFAIVPLVVFFGLESQPVWAILAATVAMEIFTIAFVLFYVGAFKENTWRQILGLCNFNLKTVAVGVGVGGLFFVGLLSIEAVMSAVGVKVEDSDTSSLFTSLTGFEKYLVLFGLVAIVVPIAEELFFRGYVYSFLQEGRTGPRATDISWAAVVFSSALFAVLHFQGAASVTDFLVLAWTFLFAVVSCLLRFKTKSLYPSMAAHSFYNGLSAIALALMSG